MSPPDTNQIERFAARVKNENIGPEPPVKKRKRATKPSAFIFGQGGWNDFELKPTHTWINVFEQIMDDPTLKAAKYLEETNPFKEPPLSKKGASPALFISPNAQGYNVSNDDARETSYTKSLDRDDQ